MIGKLILLSIFAINFRQGIYNYIPPTTMLLWYMTLQLCYGYKLWYIVHHFPLQKLRTHFTYYYYYYYYYYPRYLLYAGYLHLYSWDKTCP